MYRKTSHMVNNQSGNVFAILFGAVAMVGVLGFATYNMISGPITTMTRVNQKAMIDTQLMAATKIGVLDATNSFADYGDCDADGWVEPREWRDDGGAAGPDGVTGSNGGGYIPNGLGVSKTDPYGTEYGYCVWNAGSASTIGAVSHCDNDNVVNATDAVAGDGTERRLAGDPADPGEPIMVIYSAGPNRIFESPCRNFVDTTPNDGEPDSPLFEKGGDDIIMSFTYSEASTSAGTGGLWQIKSGDPSVATIQQEVQMRMATGATSGSGLAPSQEKILDTDCTADTLGLMRFNPLTTAIEVCNSPGTFTSLSGSGGAAGALVQDTAETCDGVTDANTDGIPDDNGKIRYNTASAIPQICQDGAWKEMILGSTSATLVISPTSKTNYVFNTDTATPPHSDWQEFTIQNTGSVASDTLTLVLGNTTNFETQNDTCTGITLDAAGGATDSCTIDIRFRSYIDGTFSGTLTVNANNLPTATLEGTASGACVIGQEVGGGIKVSCETSYDLIVMKGGCNDTTSEPTCAGTTDVLIKQLSDLGGATTYPNSPTDGAANSSAYLVYTDRNWPAVEFCDDLILNGYDDWYLPASDELEKVSTAAQAGYVTGIVDSTGYWTSTASGTSQTVTKILLPTWANWDTYETRTDNHYFRCVRRNNGGTTAPPSIPSSKPGYIVLSKGSWDGNLRGSSGLSSGLAAANQYCLDDLTNNSWMGRNNVVLDNVTVRAFLCEYSFGCQNFAPNTRYYFAKSGTPTVGGAYMDTDSKGRGPGNANNWAGTNYLGSTTEYWTARTMENTDEMDGSSLYWGTDDILFSSSTNCYSGGAWNTTSQTAVYGRASSTNEQRWEVTGGSCATPRHFLCIVHPSEGTATPPPPEPITEPGFLVMTHNSWDGDLITASGLTSPTASEAANELCYQDLLSHNWKNREQAVIEPNNVEALLNSQDAIPNATYYFARSNDTSVGGAYFTTDSLGRGPGHNYPLYALNFFGSVEEYWINRDWYGSGGASWGAGEQNLSSESCNNWSVNTGETGNFGTTNATNEDRWGYDTADACSASKHLLCMVHPSSATPSTPIQDPLENGPGYFVITSGTWDADLPTAASNAGLGTFATGWEAARALCIDDLTNNNWDGRSGATLNSTTVRPFLCGANGPNCDPLPSQRYYFATSGYVHGSTMGYFDARADKAGPGNLANWSAANYFNGAKEYWSSKDYTSTVNEYWGEGYKSGSSTERCDNYSSNSASYTGAFGSTNTTNWFRWHNSGGATCATPRHLVCLVDPSTDSATAMPNPPNHTYSIPGAYTVTIAAGQSVTFKAWGAGGGGGGASNESGDYRLGGNGGAGGYAEATITPSVDTTYYIYVGSGGMPGSSAGSAGGAGGTGWSGGHGGAGGADISNVPEVGSGGGGGALTGVFADSSTGTRIVIAGGGGGGAGSGGNYTAAHAFASDSGTQTTVSYGADGEDNGNNTGWGTGGGAGAGLDAATGTNGGGDSTSIGDNALVYGGDSYSITTIELSGSGQTPPNTAEAYYQTGAATGGQGEDASSTTPATQGGNGLVLVYYN